MSRADRRAPSIALPIFALTVIAVLLTAVLLFAVTFRGPPPRPEPMRLETLARALRDGRVPVRTDQPLHIIESNRDSALPPQAREAPATRVALAAMLKVAPANVRAYTFEPQRDTFTLRGPFSVAVRRDGEWRVLVTQPPRLLTSWHLWTLQAMALACAVLAVAAWLIARQITQPLAQLADAATRWRVGRELVVPQDGLREVRVLGEALGAMQGRLARHSESRMAMLAAIAHDLGTPLSRIAFWVEQLPEPARGRAAGDIDEMRAMLGDVLRFAREERMAEVTRIDLGSLLDALTDDLSAAGAPVMLSPGPRTLVRGDSGALRRLFANLIDNAVRYGEAARIGWRDEDDMVVVTIDDDGAGFDPALGDKLFEPFVRGDPSRNRATGGTGLGLAIARSIAEAHGGAVALGRNTQGGRVTVMLPVS